MTTSKKKNYWRLNLYTCVLIAVILVCCLAWEFFVRKAPTEPTWGEEIAKYIIMWPALTVVVCATFYAVFMPLAGKLAEVEQLKQKK